MASTQITSNGLRNWGHFTSSKRSMDLDEPIYLNLFTVFIDYESLPPAMKDTTDGQQEVNVILEGLRNVGGLQTQPGVGTAGPQKYKHAERGFAGSAPSQTHLNLTMSFEINMRREDDGSDNSYVYKFLRRWHDLIYDPQTGRMSIKKNYVCKHMTVTMQDKEGKPFHQWDIYNLFPSGGLDSFNLTYDNGAIQGPMNINFWADYFDETIL